MRSCFIFYTILSSLGFQHHDHFPTFTRERMNRFILDSQEDSQLYERVCASSVMPYSLRPYGPARFLCPCDSPGKNTGVDCHFLLQGIFPIQGSNPRLPCLLHWQGGSLPLSHLGRPLQKHSTLIMISRNICLPSKKMILDVLPLKPSKELGG